MKDKYDVAIEYLTEHPEEIGRAYIVPSRHDEAGCLFRFCTPDGMPKVVDGKQCGCLVLVKHHNFRAFTNELTAAIRADDRIPEFVEEITVEDLPTFASWQRRLDKELNRA